MIEEENSFQDANASMDGDADAGAGEESMYRFPDGRSYNDGNGNDTVSDDEYDEAEEDGTVRTQ